MGAIAQASDGTLWAGTGEANPPGGGLTYFGDGVYKSTDNGAPLDQHGPDARASRSAASRSTRRNPNNGLRRRRGPRRPQRRRSAACTARPTPARRGSSCSRPTNATTGAIDVAINPKNPQIVYAALWDHKRTNGTRTYGGIGSGLFRSDDGGTTWKRLETMGAGQALPDLRRRRRPA